MVFCSCGNSLGTDHPNTPLWLAPYVVGEAEVCRQEFKRERKKRKRSGELNIIKSNSSFWGRSSLIIEFTVDSDVADEVRAFRANAN